jgi:phospholipid/cholesterol/gamma-HCH transport system substrate-binding protein
MKKNTLDYWVGLFVVVGFAALLFLALKAGNMSSFSFQETYAVTAQFDNIGGLKPRAPSRARAWWWAAWHRSASTTRTTRPR